MPIKHTYAEHGDACRAANALDVVGDRWSLVIAREVVLGPKRFADLLASVRGITPSVLSERLRTLQAAGVVEPVVLSDLGRTRAYQATPWGRGLESVLESLGRWYSAGPSPETAGGMTPDGVALAMRTMAPPGWSSGPALALTLHDGRLSDPPSFPYTVDSDDGRLTVTPGLPAAARTSIRADATAWSEVLFGTTSLAAAEHDGGVVVGGDRSEAARLVKAFRTPAA
ncbi:winged helix-turn-helix transcriptional regulator [Microbacterium lushaniae]|uniref:winged helix-turn-helix transcriptional regulator n=1 Tax=Microbacterium lushaniae TaxID=2614639 RepID=UPI00177D393B|nr:helix-turn-helix domain-containing protein [Microbacterium lushaniae]